MLDLLVGKPSVIQTRDREEEERELYCQVSEHQPVFTSPSVIVTADS